MIKYLAITILILISCNWASSCFPMDLTKAVVHHTVITDSSLEMIRKIKVEEIGYHFLIRANGKIEEGKPIAKNRNHYISIALTGYNEFTAEQELMLIQLLLDLKITHIERHTKVCPGPGLNIEWIQEIIRREP